MPGLGLGLELPKMIDGSSSLGIIDRLGGIVASGFVLGFSYHLLTRDYKGYCLRVRRASDDDVLDIGFVNGYIDYVAIATFCAGTNGFVAIRYNQYSAGNDAVQVVLASQPKIYDSVTGFIDDGIELDGTDDYLTVVDYVAMQITSPVLNIYMNRKSIDADTRYIFAKNEFTTTVTYALIQTVTRYALKVDTTLIYSDVYAFTTNKILAAWNGTGVNESLVEVDGSIIRSTLNPSPSNLTKIVIGARNGPGDVPTSFANGNIKTIIVFNTNRENDYTKIASLV